MKTPFIIGIGAQKAGSTWLGDYFSNHPDICFSPRKEIHYFDAKYLDIYRDLEKSKIESFKKLSKRIRLKTINQTVYDRLRYLIYRLEMVNDPNAYLRYFKSLHQGEKYFCEITPNYSMLTHKGFKAMKKMLGNVKIIFLMRNPIDRHWSHLKFKNKKNPNFNYEKQFENSFNLKHFHGAGDYVHTLKHVNKIFPKKDFLVLFYEHLFDPEIQMDYFKKVINFLDIQDIEPAFRIRKNTSSSTKLDIERRKYGVSQLKDVYEYIIKNFEDVPQNWKSDLDLIS